MAEALASGYGPPVLSRFFRVWCLRTVYEREEKRMLEGGMREDEFPLRLVRAGLASCDEAEKQIAQEFRREMGWED